MDNEIEFTMIEIKDIGKLQKSELVKDETFEAEITQVSDLSEAYCRDMPYLFVKSSAALNFT